MKRTPELLAIRDEIDTALNSQAQADETATSAAESPQTEAGESQPSMQEGVEEAMPATEVEAEAEQAIRYINDLATAAGLEPEEFYKLPIKLGGNREIPLGEAKDRIAQLDTERQQIEQQRALLAQQAQDMQARMANAQQAQTQLTERQARAHQTLAAIDGQLRNKQMEWDKRREIEPGKVALEQQEIAAARAAAQQELQVAQMEADQQQNIAHQQWLAQQHNILTQQIPDWAIPEKRQSLQRELQEFAMSRYHATAEELRNLDAKTIMLLRDAMEGVKAKTQAEKAISELKTKPPVAPRSARQSAVTQHRADVAALEKQALATGKTQDRLAAARAILGNRQ